MKKLLTVLLAIGLVATFTACDNEKQPSGNSGNSGTQISGNPNEENQEGNEQEGNNQETEKATVLYENNGTKEVGLKISGNPSTGYSWSPTNYSADYVRVEILEDGEENSGENDLVGAPTFFGFKIVGLAEGFTQVQFDYYRAWEGMESSIETKLFNVEIDSNLEVIVTEYEEPAPEDEFEEILGEDDFTPSQELQSLVDTLITESGVQFAMPGSMKIMLANAPTFVGLSEQLFTQYVTDSIVYEPMISPATSSLCIVKVSDEANVSDLKQEVIDNANPRKWICTGAEKCLAIDSGNYILLIMSTPDNCEAMKNAFTKHFGADNVGEALTKDGVPAQDFGDDFGGGMLLE